MSLRTHVEGGWPRGGPNLSHTEYLAVYVCVVCNIKNGVLRLNSRDVYFPYCRSPVKVYGSPDEFKLSVLRLSIEDTS